MSVQRKLGSALGLILCQSNFGPQGGGFITSSQRIQRMHLECIDTIDTGVNHEKLNAGTEWHEEQAMKLKGMLEASIQRRFPKGLKVRVRDLERSSCLRDLAQRLRAANLSITRAKVPGPPNRPQPLLHLSLLDSCPRKLL